MECGILPNDSEPLSNLETVCGGLVILGMVATVGSLSLANECYQQMKRASYVLRGVSYKLVEKIRGRDLMFSYYERV